MLESLQRVTDAALAHLSRGGPPGGAAASASPRSSTPTPPRSCCSSRAASSCARAPPRGSRRRSSRACGSRSAAASPAGSPPSAAPITIDDVDHADILNPILREKGIRSLLGVPLLVEDRVIGVLHVGTPHPRSFTPDDRDLLQLAADRAALAIEHAELYEQRRLAEVLQRRLLPEELPAIPGLELASRYLPATRREPRRRLVRRVRARRRADRARGRRRRRPRPRPRRR